jgi:hypothetical protein
MTPRDRAIEAVASWLASIGVPPDKTTQAATVLVDEGARLRGAANR